MAKHIKLYDTFLDAQVGLENGEFESPYVIGTKDGNVYYDGDITSLGVDLYFLDGEGNKIHTITVPATSQTITIYLDSFNDHYHFTEYRVWDSNGGEYPIIQPNTIGSSAQTYSLNNWSKNSAETSVYYAALAFEDDYGNIYEIQKSINVISEGAVAIATATITTTEPNETKAVFNSYGYYDWSLTKIDGAAPDADKWYNNTYTFDEPGVHTIECLIGSQTLSPTFRTSEIETISFYGITNIAHNALRGASNLVSVDLTGVETAGNCMFQDCTSLTGVVFTSAFTNAGYSTFNGCTGLTTVDYMESSIPDIETGDFKNCYSLTTLEFPESVTEIKSNTSYPTCVGCTGLTDVIFHSTGVTSIGDGMFMSGCDSLTAITCNSPIAPSAGTSSFDGITGNTGVLYVPAGADYSSWLELLGENWSLFEESVDVYINYTRYLGTNTIPIFNGDYSVNDFAEIKVLSGGEEVDIKEDIVGNEYTFDSSLSTYSLHFKVPGKNLTTQFNNVQGMVDLSIESTSDFNLSEYSFAGCTELRNIAFGDSPITINTTAFSGCQNIERINFYGNEVPTMIGEAPMDTIYVLGQYVYVPGTPSSDWINWRNTYLPNWNII